MTINGANFSITPTTLCNNGSVEKYFTGGAPSGWSVGALGSGGSVDVSKTTGSGAEYFVTKSGSDSNDGLSLGNAFLTIQHALDSVSAGDTITISAGTYTETSDISDGDTPVAFSLAARVSGTASEPITIRAASGDENAVIIDGQDSRGGLHCNRFDYYNVYDLRFVNTRIGSIRNYSQSGNLTPTDGKSQGWRIIDNEFDHVTGPSGVNTSHIAMWATEDWVVYNNDINDASLADSGSNAAGIQAYGTINAFVKNNTITNAHYGIYWKDHFVADESYTPVVNSEISYNLIENTTSSIAIHGANEQAGSNNIHHNIFRGYSDAGVKALTKYGDSPVDPTGLTIEHNIFDPVSAGGESSAIFADEYKDIKINGNIFVRDRIAITMWQWTGEWAEITEADYNVYGTISLYIAALDYNYGGVTFATLAAWQAATSASATSLTIDNPDTNGVSSSEAALFTDIANGDYTHASGSPAVGVMSDGSNAGPYQIGTETIGRGA